MAADGAHILDVGAESSRPGAAPVGLDEELRRALPAVAAAVATGLPVSVDTWRAETARRALALGAVMVNDITGLRGDPDMAGVVADVEPLGVRRVMLATADAHGLYAQFGFEGVRAPEKYMVLGAH